MLWVLPAEHSHSAVLLVAEESSLTTDLISRLQNGEGSTPAISSWGTLWCPIPACKWISAIIQTVKTFPATSTRPRPHTRGLFWTASSPSPLSTLHSRRWTSHSEVVGETPGAPHCLSSLSVGQEKPSPCGAASSPAPLRHTPCGRVQAGSPCAPHTSCAFVPCCCHQPGQSLCPQSLHFSPAFSVWQVAPLQAWFKCQCLSPRLPQPR